MKLRFSRKIKRAITLFFAGFLLAAVIASCASPNQSSSVKSKAVIAADDIAAPLVPPGKTLAEIADNKEVRIAVPDDFPPFGGVGPDMNLRGYDIDVSKEVAKALNVDLKLVPVVGNYRIPFLQTNRVDLVISSLGKNKDRALIIDFSKPYAPFFSGIYGNEGIKVSSFEELKGQSVGVAQGSLEDLELSKQPPGIEIKRFANNSLTASALVSGQVQLIATGNVVAAKLIKDNPGLKIENKFIMKNSPCHIGLRKGDKDLLERVNEIIISLKESGKLNELSLKWFGEPLPDLSVS